MSALRARKDHAKRVGVALTNDYRALVEASGPDEVQVAAIQLGNTFNANIEFIINVMKAYGGLRPSFDSMVQHSK